MKRVHLFAVILFGLAALIGCAGSGDSGTNTTGGNIVPGVPRLEAVVAISRSNLKDPNKYTDAELRDPTKIDPNDLIDPTLYGVADPRNIQTGETYWFQLVSYDLAGNRHIINDNVVFQTSDTTGRYGNVGSNSGLFVAGNNTNPGDEFIFAFYEGTRYEARYNIKPRQVRLLGRVLTEDTQAPVAGVEVFFYDNFNSLVGVVRTGYDGTFRASVPTNTVRFQPTVDSVPVEYYQSFLYEGLRYSIGYPQCKATLPSLEPGTVILNQPIYLRTRVEGELTPPPTGCSI